jgi:hypothetical protein
VIVMVKLTESFDIKIEELLTCKTLRFGSIDVEENINTETLNVVVIKGRGRRCG